MKFSKESWTRTIAEHEILGFAAALLKEPAGPFNMESQEARCTQGHRKQPCQWLKSHSHSPTLTPRS